MLHPVFDQAFSKQALKQPIVFYLWAEFQGFFFEKLLLSTPHFDDLHTA
jgi:hypothetical protein